MSESPTSTDQSIVYRPWLHLFAVLLVAATFVLLVAGGTVTSTGAGLAVPDWPTTWGHNMFAVPFNKWIGRGGIFWEHLHRLIGSAIGMLCIVMTVWLWVTQRRRPWLRTLGVVLLVAVIVQGVMGGLRVTLPSLTLAIVHGISGQLFLCLTVLIAAATSRYWIEASPLPARPNVAALPRLSLALLVVLLVQLTLGALTRHMEAGLAIPDFPLAYGRIVPPFDAAGIEQATDRMAMDEAVAESSYFAPSQVAVHYAHRLWAVIVLFVLGWLSVRLWAAANAANFTVPAGSLIVMAFMQATLGISVITSGRHAHIATAHQVLGAAMLATAALLAIRLFRFFEYGHLPKANERVSPTVVLEGGEA